MLTISQKLVSDTMKKPKIAKIFFQTTRGKTKERKRGYMTIPASIVRELEGDGWSSKDTVWIGVADTTRGFMVFHNIEDYFRHIRRIEQYEKDTNKYIKKKRDGEGYMISKPKRKRRAKKR